MRTAMRASILAILPAAAWTGPAPGAPPAPRPAAPPIVQAIRVPESGLQPRTALGADGTIHLVYVKGALDQGDTMYARRPPAAGAFHLPVRVNSQPGSCAASGTIRGPALAVEPDGRAHVLWCGSADAQPRAPLDPNQPKDSRHNGTPLLYSRSDESGTAFEPQRNLMMVSWALDGGAAIAADAKGRITAVWHAAHAAGGTGESGRAVFAARSSDHGARFSPELRIEAADDGACACCGLGAAGDAGGVLAVLYRRAHKGADRDMAVLLSGRSAAYTKTLLEPWQINACPMTTATVLAHADRFLLAWETKGVITLAAMHAQTGKIEARAVPPGDARGRKYPAIAARDSGDVLLTWAEGAGWGKGGSVAWQVFDRDLRPVQDGSGSAPELPAWSFPAAVAQGDGFIVLY